MPNFDDIRPYNDSEVSVVLARLLNDPELQQAVASLKFPRLAKRLPWLLRPVVKQLLKRQLAGIHTVRQLQELLERYMDSMIASTVSELTFSGLDKLQAGKSYLFVSNHRDIAMDPAFVNLALIKSGFDSVRIAIGDNLLSKPYVSDLMRMNKCFIVNRSASGAREKFKAAKHLSSYIHHSITEENSHIWIAQREGRAKDGLDATNSAVVSMLALSKPKKMSLGEYIKELNVVPVSISYEWDPCDEAKARELDAHLQHGRYEKAEDEDIASIAAGISGEKGHVHVAFGQVIAGEFESTEQVAQAIDAQVWDNYVLHPSNHFAYEQQHNASVNFPVGAQASPFDASAYKAEKKQLEQRLASLTPEQRALFLGIYANSIVSKQNLSGQPSEG